MSAAFGLYANASTIDRSSLLMRIITHANNIVLSEFIVKYRSLNV